MQGFLDYFSSRSFMPHGHCYLWRPDILWMNVGSDAMIAAAYFSIPVSLVYFVKRRPDFSFNWAFWMFAAFILLCGTTHLFEIWTTWNPNYAVQGLLKFATGVVSLATAVLLWPLMPKALALPSTKDLTAANENLLAANAAMEAEVRRRTAELAKSEAAFRETFNLAPVGIAHVGLKGEWLRVNSALCIITGYSEADLLSGMTFADITHPDDIEKDWTEARRLLAGEISSYSMDKRYLRADGTLVWVNLTASLKRSDGGEPAFFIAVIDDITARKDAEETLRASEAAVRKSEAKAQQAARIAETESLRLNAILQAAPNAIAVADASGRLIRFNPGNDRLWGPAPFSASVEDYREYKGWWADGTARHGRPIEAQEWAMSRALSGEAVPGDVVEIEPFDAPGARKSAVISAAPVRDADGTIYGAVTVQTDVTDLVRTRAELAESEANFRLLADTIQQLCWMAHSDGHIFWFNQRWYDYTGTTLAETQGWGWQKVHHPDHVERVLREVQESWARGEAFELTSPLRSRSGEYGWFLTRVAPLKDAAGNVLRWFGSNTDITALRAANEALRKAEETFRTVTDNAASGLFMMDKAGHPIFMNPAAKRITGYQDLEEIARRPLHYAVHWKKPDGSPYPMEECPIDNAQAQLVAARDQEEIFCTKDGRLFPVVYSIAPLAGDGEVRGSVLEFRDVTDAKRAELALRESEAKFRTIAEAMPQMVWSTLANGHHDYFNRRWYEFTGVTEGSTDGEGWSEVFHPDDRARALDEWRRSLASGAPYSIEYRLRHHSGEYRWTLGRALPVRDGNGRIVRWMGTSTDIDSQKRSAEILEQKVRERTSELEAANKELEAFSYSVSHDLRAPLRGIDGFSDVLIRRFGPTLTNEAQGYLMRVKEAARRMSHLIDDMLKLSRLTRRELARQPVDITAVATAIVEALRGAEPGRSVTVTIEPGLMAWADAVLITAVLENLIGNAWKFTRMTVAPRIEIRSSDEIAPDGTKVRAFVVEDNGAGFDMTYQKKLFGAFQRLHTVDEFEGTGIGLASVHRIVRRHGGLVWAKGEVSKGATFFFTLPGNGSNPEVV